MRAGARSKSPTMQTCASGAQDQVRAGRHAGPPAQRLPQGRQGLDPRLPPPGTYLEREYKGRRIIAKILVDGFEFDGEIYRSLSAIAQEATGTKWNGFLFFNLTSMEEIPMAKRSASQAPDKASNGSGEGKVVRCAI